MAKLWNPIFSNVDIEILLFLWRHRLATFQALKNIFYPTLSNRQVYDKLKRLKRGNYVAMNELYGSHNQVFMLGKRGISFVVNELMIESKTKTHKPQSVRHDLFAMAALLGDWMVEAPREIKIVTEMELMETEVLELPEDLRLKPEHRPDGLWIFKNGNDYSAISLEVEISRKTTIRYDSVCAFYNRNLFYKNVIWIVDAKALALRINEAAQKYGNTRPGLHLFILQKDFEKHVWQSEFINTSMKGITLGTYLNQQLRLSRSSPQHSLNNVTTENHYSSKPQISSPLLNFEFSLENSFTCKNSESS